MHLSVPNIMPIYCVFPPYCFLKTAQTRDEVSLLNKILLKTVASLWDTFQISTELKIKHVIAYICHINMCECGLLLLSFVVMSIKFYLCLYGKYRKKMYKIFLYIFKLEKVFLLMFYYYTHSHTYVQRCVLRFLNNQFAARYDISCIFSSKFTH